MEKQQQMKRKKKKKKNKKNKKKNNKNEDSGGESGDDKCMVCGEKEEDDVDIEDWVDVKCVHSGYILSAYPPIIHTLYHMQTFIAIFVYSSNFH